MRPRAVLFDLDDTLFDHQFATVAALARLKADEPAFRAWSTDVLFARHSDALETMHAQVLAGKLTIDDARRLRFQRLLSEAGSQDASDERAVALAAMYRGAYQTGWRAIPGACELLAALRSAGLRIAIVTNNLIAEQTLKLSTCALDVHVDALVTSEEVGVPKPDVRIFEHALARVDVEPRDAVMVGDAWSTDIVGALAAGIRPVWFNWRRTASPDATVAELASLEPLDTAVQVILA